VPNLGPAELFVIFIVALLVFGPNKLPDIGRQVGKAVREFRRVQSSLTDDFKDAFSTEEVARPPAPAVPPPAPAPERQTEPVADAAEGAPPGTESR
jgi:sec-independent protein translocase protein TatA